MPGDGLVWVTRAEPGAARTAARVQALGRTPLVAPVLEVRPVSASVDLSGVAALAFTSANAVRAFAALIPDRALPAYAVGEATAAALREAGFPLAEVGEGGADDLARVILGSPLASARGAVLHPCARTPAGDLVGVLGGGGLEARPLVVYETSSVTALPATLRAELAAGRIEAVLLHSPRAAAALACLLSHDLVEGLGRTRALGLSPACLSPWAICLSPPDWPPPALRIQRSWRSSDPRPWRRAPAC